ncbi:MAG TPA: ABC transporter permease [Bdellovibrionales bacterium]|mgnify:CR=1 FL=1|nr:ABC transporter permease [Pseudobdellovibrionaceae bacterium]HAG91762.1 ABC transporter permease [Bdellovibrionales bacterium]|tara:strand:- start:1340 stop:2128 length:789 start_codon:yes stop_codon:yes gene_type:complete
MKSQKYLPFFSLLHREISRFFKVAAQTVLTPMINSSLYLLIFGISLGPSIHIEGGISYLAFLIPGLVMMACLNNSFQNSSSSVVGAKFGGDLEDLKSAPLTPQNLIWAYSLGALTRGLIVGSLTFLVGEIFFYVSEGHWLAVQHPLILMVFLVIGSFTFSQLGISVAFWAKTFDQLSAVSGFVLLPLIYLGGVFYSVSNLHPFWQAVSRSNPLLYLINGVREGILGTSDVQMPLAFAVALAGFLVTHALAYWSLKKGSYLRW